MSRAILKLAAVSGVVLMAGIATSGCASHKFVRENLAIVDGRVSQVDGRVTDVDSHVTRVEGTAGEALARATAAGKLAEGKFLYEVVLSDDSVKFPVNKDALSPEAESRLSALADKLKTENRNVYLEIQGHTDATGDAKYNQALGEARAEAVRRYLSQQHVALSRMATISYGENEPVAPNDTPDGRAQNRRVSIVVLS